MADNAGTDLSGDEAVRQEATTLGSVFDPATLRVLQEAFDMAWTEAVTLPIVRTDEQGARDFIAERIVRAARMTDERDPERLKAFALQAFETPAELRALPDDETIPHAAFHPPRQVSPVRLPASR